LVIDYLRLKFIRQLSDRFVICFFIIWDFIGWVVSIRWQKSLTLTKVFNLRKCFETKIRWKKSIDMKSILKSEIVNPKSKSSVGLFQSVGKNKVSKPCHVQS